MRLNKHSITSQMVFSLVSTSLFIVILGTLFQVLYNIDHEKRAFIRESALEADLIVDLVTAPLAFFDIQGVETNLQRLHENKDVLMAVIYDPNKKPLTAISSAHQLLPHAILPLGIMLSFL